MNFIHVIKPVWCFVLFCCLTMGAATADNGLPYQAGSVFNLKTYLPWESDSAEIVRYPIGCSVNDLADVTLQYFFPESRGSFTDVFHSDCARHDLCYRHGSYTYHFSKDDCDNQFADGLARSCRRQFQGDDRVRCERTAGILILAARKFGHLSYHADDYPFRDYGYYFEYQNDRSGQYAIFWSMLGADAEFYRNLYRTRVNGNLTLPSLQRSRRLLVDFFTKKISFNELLLRMRDSHQ